MDALLQRVTAQAVSYAIRSGITITTGYALKECGRLLKQAPKSRERDELMQLQVRLDSKIRVIAPSIDMIELIAARGNTSLESALSLCQGLRYDIQKLGQRLDKAAQEEQRLRGCRGAAREDANHELVAIISQIKLLLARIEDAVPLISLAITTSGVNLSTKLSGTISPSRLLQASTFLTTADTRFTSNPVMRLQVGPTYVVSLYMLFAGHSTRAEGHETTWQTVLQKARLKLWRVPLHQLYSLPGETAEPNRHEGNAVPAEAKTTEYGYQLTIVEDLDDGLVHEPEDGDPQPGPFDGVEEAGIRDIFPVHEVSKIFYCDEAKLLNIGGEDEVTQPCLLLKRDVHAEPPRRMMRPSRSRASSVANSSQDEDEDQSEIDAQIERESRTDNYPVPTREPGHNAPPHRLPPSLDPEWMAFKVYTEAEDSDSEDDEPTRPQTSRSTSFSPLSSALAHLSLSSPRNGNHADSRSATLALSPGKRSGPPVKTTLSLLEMLLKLAALQQFRQESHLAIEDELLNFFLEDSATAGAGADKQHRQQIRHAAIQRVGFDPYDESPIKRRGEQYIQKAGASPGSLRGSPGPAALSTELAYDEDYEYSAQMPSLDFHRPMLERPSPGRGGLPSSPSPHATKYQQTPSRTSTPDLSLNTQSSAAQAKDGGGASATSPSAQKTRAGALRTQSDLVKPRSPLHEVHAPDYRED